jgi:hypothetical protein
MEVDKVEDMWKVFLDMTESSRCSLPQLIKRKLDLLELLIVGIDGYTVDDTTTTEGGEWINTHFKHEGAALHMKPELTVMVHCVVYCLVHQLIS